MSDHYLTDAPVVRVWRAADAGYTAYQWDTVKNRYYFTEGPIWLPVNARQSGDFVAADYSVDQEVAGFQLHAVLAFDICAANQRPASVEVPPQPGFDYDALWEVMVALAHKWTVEFFPHVSMLTPDSSPSDTFRAVIDGKPQVGRPDGQGISRVSITWKGTKCVSDPPQDF